MSEHVCLCVLHITFIYIRMHCGIYIISRVLMCL